MLVISRIQIGLSAFIRSDVRLTEREERTLGTNKEERTRSREKKMKSARKKHIRKESEQRRKAISKTTLQMVLEGCDWHSNYTNILYVNYKFSNNF